MAKLSQSDFLSEVNRKVGVIPIGKGDYSSTEMVPRQIKALGCMVVAQG
jgi:hypothetical protein